ncbi:sugar ABC transporter permease [Paenibacillus psychroresistens]|uniref:Sugar ABC transporter permease n=1 Tax=Paenibacillus psychroresistens TaxID=1778678 RepID=A0A6B8RFH2_9BACL|nr:sugar ABC transporter permease [Paenibacillus psychroresistens]QGQ94325.1 sugar ABC transporter permease [Paenibacillus psychroresistens]
MGEMMKANNKTMLVSVFFVLPSLILYLVFTYIPFISSSYYAFFLWDAVTLPKYIGMRNFVDIFHDQKLLYGLNNTLIMCLVGVLIQNPLSLILGLMLNRNFKSRAFLRAAFYLPVVLALVVISVVWGQILQYDGLFNYLLDKVGLDFLIRDWLGKVQTSFPTIVGLATWQGLGFCALIYLAGLQSIPVDLYEAAAMDGASGWQKLKNITVPLLMPTVSIVTFLILTGSLKLFDLPYIMTNGGPGTSSYTISLAIFNAAFMVGNYGYAIAMGLVFMVLILIVSVIQLKLTGRKEVEL